MRKQINEAIQKAMTVFPHVFDQRLSLGHERLAANASTNFTSFLIQKDASIFAELIPIKVL
jgi:hypothetical protein